ncbi:hypothetical protein T492DRAFT_856598 [Pavlovales sp. CCMP2436]|nr:hypothetical protein T492DRAFT_856598 [Pavlovales sp. CCMP2436]
MGVASLCNGLSNGLVALTFLPLSRSLAARSFVPFGCVLVLYTSYAYVALPETLESQSEPKRGAAGSTVAAACAVPVAESDEA